MIDLAWPLPTSCSSPAYFLYISIRNREGLNAVQDCSATAKTWMCYQHSFGLLVTNPICSTIGVPVKLPPHQSKPAIPAEGTANHINTVLKNKDKPVPGFSCNTELPFLSYSTFLCMEYYKSTQLILEEE